MEIIANVYQIQDSLIGSSVELSNGITKVMGKVVTEGQNDFVVDWSDGVQSTENKSDYELVIESKTAFKGQCQVAGCSQEQAGYGVCADHQATPIIVDELQSEVARRKKEETGQSVASVKTAQENPAQPAGWAVPPVDENAYPNGELLEVEMEKRQDTAAWEDSQNRAPVDAENPAQPAGYAVPPASGQPIPGQGADALAVKANVYAENVAGENGRVELENGTLHFAGRVVAADDEIFIVEWDDDSRTIENKSDYDLIITSSAPDPEAERFDTISMLFSKPTGDGRFNCSYCNNFTGSSNSEVVQHFYEEHEHDGEFEWGMLPGADDV